MNKRKRPAARNGDTQKPPKSAIRRRMQIWDLHEGGMTYRQIGDKFGISRQRAAHMARKSLEDIAKGYR